MGVSGVPLPTTRPEERNRFKWSTEQTLTFGTTIGRCLRIYVRGPINKFALLKSNPTHGSLQFKKIGIREGEEIWSVRVTLKYRALAFKDGADYVWFWIGDHNVYDVLIKAP
jgi:hypothetical protein